jgi:hypothetical protein
VQLIAIIIATILTAASGYWSAAMLESVSGVHDTNGLIAVYSTAGAMTAAQVLFGVWAKEENGRIYGLASALLIVVSVTGTASWLESNTLTDATRATNEDVYYQRLVMRYDSQVAELIAIKQDAQHDKDTGFITRGNNKLEASTLLSKQVDAGFNEIRNYQPVATNQGIVISTLGPARWGIWICFALMVDVTAILTLKRGMAPRPVADKEPSQKSLNTVMSTADGFEHVLSSATQTVAAATSVSEQISAAVSSGHYGQQPAIRRVIQDFNIRHPEAKAIFEDMQSKGLLSMDETKRRWQLPQAV